MKKASVTVLAAMAVIVMAIPALAGENEKLRRTYYNNAIANEIIRCHDLEMLLASDSPRLRLKGHREAFKALFLEVYKEQLVNAMMVLNLDCKQYKVHLFLNKCFRLQGSHRHFQRSFDRG